MGMTKAIQERVFITANLTCPQTRFICVRYGNVLASRGSVIPLFHEQIRCGGPLTITTSDMTRFLLSLEQAVDTIFAALGGAKAGETYIPRVPSARMIDLAKALIGDRRIEIQVTGIRPGEKVDEILISEEERYRTVDRGRYYAIQPILPELRTPDDHPANLDGEFSSATDLMDYDALCRLLVEKRLRLEDADSHGGELLR
jgi:FlaA1/EpsC-like NDP-sugar epimerase